MIAAMPASTANLLQGRMALPSATPARSIPGTSQTAAFFLWIKLGLAPFTNPQLPTFFITASSVSGEKENNFKSLFFRHLHS